MLKHVKCMTPFATSRLNRITSTVCFFLLLYFAQNITLQWSPHLCKRKKNLEGAWKDRTSRRRPAVPRLPTPHHTSLTAGNCQRSRFRIWRCGCYSTSIAKVLQAQLGWLVKLLKKGGFLTTWCYPRTMGFPWFSYQKWSCWGAFWGYHHLKKHPYHLHLPKESCDLKSGRLEFLQPCEKFSQTPL